MRKLYTFVLEFDGGTYVSQHAGRTVREASKKWRAVQEAANHGGWSAQDRKRLFTQLAAESPVELTDVSHVYCASASIGARLALLTIVLTSADHLTPRLGETTKQRASVSIAREAVRASSLLRGKIVQRVRRHRINEVIVEFTDGTRLHVDASAAVEMSVTGGE